MLNGDVALAEIHKLALKHKRVPSAPSFVVEECTSEPAPASSLILSWHPVHFDSSSSSQQQQQQGYVLELDEGAPETPFKRVYCGPETVCQVNGIAPEAVYSARVKAFNAAGCSDYSAVLSLPVVSSSSSSSSLLLSPGLGCFALNAKTSHPDALFSNGYLSASALSFEDRVVLGSTGFAHGVHYWEVSIDRYDQQPDPAFGVARYDVPTDRMLGKCAKSWCMYIDSARSWFMHAGKHTGRIEAGIRQDCVVGVLLDLDARTLSFYVNDEPHGGIAFINLPPTGVFYPAISLNKNVQVTVASGLEPPPTASSLNNSDSDNY